MTKTASRSEGKKATAPEKPEAKKPESAEKPRSYQHFAYEQRRVRVVLEPADALSYTPKGTAKWRLAFPIQQTGLAEGEQGEALWYDVAVWGELAEVMAETVKKGDVLLLVGRWGVNRYESEGEARERSVFTADEVAVVLQLPRAE